MVESQPGYMVLDLGVGLFQFLNSFVGISTFRDRVVVFLAGGLLYLMVATVVGVLVVGFLPRFRGQRRRILEFFLAASVSGLVARYGITELIRLFYNRPRPFEVLEGVRQLIEHSTGGSFPSGHAAAAFAIATAVAYYYPRASIAFFAAALLVSIARIAAGLHWPSDILGGAVVGIFTGGAIYWFIKKYKRPPTS